MEIGLPKRFELADISGTGKYLVVVDRTDKAVPHQLSAKRPRVLSSPSGRIYRMEGKTDKKSPDSDPSPKFIS